MKKTITKSELMILKSFIEVEIPHFIRETVTEKIDFMEYYEELFNYSVAIINGNAIDFSKSSFGNGKSFVFNNEYKKELITLITNSKEKNVIIYSTLSLAVLEILKNLQ